MRTHYVAIVAIVAIVLMVALTYFTSYYQPQAYYPEIAEIELEPETDLFGEAITAVRHKICKQRSIYNCFYKQVCYEQDEEDLFETTKLGSEGQIIELRIEYKCFQGKFYPKERYEKFVLKRADELKEKNKCLYEDDSYYDGDVVVNYLDKPFICKGDLPIGQDIIAVE